MSIARKLLVPGLVIAGLAGGAYYLHQRPTQGNYSLRNLASQTPKQAFFWMAAEARDHFQFEQLATQIQDMRGSFPDINESLTQLEHTSGKSVEEILKIYGSSGYIALLSLPERSDLMPVGDELPLDLVSSQPDLYTFYCQGRHHKSLVPENFPQYNAMQGLIERP